MTNKINKVEIEQIKQECLSEITKAGSFEELESVRVRYFGRKGKFKNLFSLLQHLPLEERKIYGELLNNIVEELKTKLDAKLKEFSSSLPSHVTFSRLELTLPGVSFRVGKIHPLQIVYNEIIDVFLRLGFSVKYGPEIEFEDYNFTMLNIPFDHPARDMQDTLYLDLPVTQYGKLLLRTHTSPVQIRVLLDEKPPIKSIMPGRVYRHENLDATHLFNFHQVEGLMVDKGVKLSDLKGVLTYFVKSIFGKDIKCRFRQSYFPFTEPSLEMDIACLVCKGEGCSVCKQSGYVEVLGCGMVHPQVLYNVGLGYEEYTGFAFGLGVERIAMLKYKIDDIRLFYENDLRFIEQF